MTMEQMVALGLPKLAEGLFYRVYSDSWGSVYLEIRKERKIGSRLLAREHTCRWNTETPEETIVRLHERMEKNDAHYAEKSLYWATMSALEGDHK